MHHIALFDTSNSIWILFTGWAPKHYGIPFVTHHKTKINKTINLKKFPIGNDKMVGYAFNSETERSISGW